MFETVAIVVCLGALWLLDGYRMWRRRALILAQHVERGDLKAARAFLSHWRDNA